MQASPRVRRAWRHEHGRQSIFDANLHRMLGRCPPSSPWVAPRRWHAGPTSTPSICKPVIKARPDMQACRAVCKPTWLRGLCKRTANDDQELRAAPTYGRWRPMRWSETPSGSIHQGGGRWPSPCPRCCSRCNPARGTERDSAAGAGAVLAHASLSETMLSFHGKPGIRGERTEGSDDPSAMRARRWASCA